MLRGALSSGEARGVFHGVITKMVPKFRAKYVPRETYLTEAQFSRLLWHIVAPPHPSATQKTIEKLPAHAAEPHPLLHGDRVRLTETR